MGLTTKFQLKLTIFIFWTKFSQKWYFLTKAKKSHFSVCPWLLLTILNFPAREPTDTTVPNHATPIKGVPKYATYANCRTLHLDCI